MVALWNFAGDVIVMVVETIFTGFLFFVLIVLIAAFIVDPIAESRKNRR